MPQLYLVVEHKCAGMQAYLEATQPAHPLIKVHFLVDDAVGGVKQVARAVDLSPSNLPPDSKEEPCGKLEVICSLGGATSLSSSINRVALCRHK